jgi:hypothetical protein
MATLMFSLMKGENNMKLVENILFGKFDVHSYTLFKTNEELININPSHP